MADPVEVRLGADTGDVKGQFSGAADSVQASLTKIGEALASLGATNDRILGQLKKNNADVTRSFQSLGTQITTSMRSAVTEMAAFGSTARRAFEWIVAGGIFAAAIESVSALERSVRSLETTMGMNSEKATQYAIALKLGGTTADEFTTMALHVGRQLKTNSEEFDRLGIKIRDANGNLLPMEGILENVYKRMQDFKAGTDQDLLALSAVGRSSKEFAETMRELHENLGRAAEMQRELGIEMGPERAAQIRAYHTEMNALRVTFEAVSTVSMERVLPALKNLAAWMNSEGPAAMGYMATAVQFVASVFTALGALFAATGRNIGNTIAAVVVHFGYLGDAVKALARLDWGGVWRAAQGALNNVKEYARATMENVVNSTRSAVAAVQKLWSDQASPKGKDVGAGPIPSGKESFIPKPGPGAATQLDLWKQQLAELQMAAGYFREFDKAQEAAFWESKLALVKKGTKDYVEIYRLMFEARKAAAREELAGALETLQREIDQAKNNKDQQIAIAVARTAMVKATFGEESKEFQRTLDEEIRLRNEWAVKDQQIVLIRMKMAQAQAEHVVEMDKMAADQSVALGRMSAEQRFAIEQRLEDRLYTLKLKAAEDALAAEKGGPNDPVKVAELNAQIEALALDHQKRLTDIANRAELERMKYALEAQQAVTSGLESLLAKLVEQPKSWKQAFLDAAKSIAAELDKIAAKQVIQKFLGAGTSGGNWLSDAMGKIFGGGTDGGSEKLSLAGSILEKAGLALSEAALALKSSAGFGGGGGGAGGLADFLPDIFAAGIPMFDTGTPMIERSGLAMVHKGEAIVPGGRGGGAARTGNVNVSNTFLLAGPVDTRTQAQIAMANGRTVELATRRNR